jgi:hypothetical protein
MKRAIILPSLVIAFVALSPAATAFADPSTNPGNPSGTGQPNQEADDQPSQPPGFSSGGFVNVASTHYAGEQPQNSRNPKSVSQYDVAAYR